VTVANSFAESRRKEVTLIFVNLDTEQGCRQVAISGNATELISVSCSPGESYLFSLRCKSPGIGSARDRGIVIAKRHGSCGAQWLAREGMSSWMLSCQIVPITAAGLQGEQPLVDRIM
jgi:hypothetical protein